MRLPVIVLVTLALPACALAASSNPTGLPAGRTGTMTGDLTLRGVTRPMTLKVAFIAVGHAFPFGTVAGFSATGSLKRSDFGSHNLLSYVGDEVSLEIEGEFDHK